MSRPGQCSPAKQPYPTTGPLLLCANRPVQPAFFLLHLDKLHQRSAQCPEMPHPLCLRVCFTDSVPGLSRSLHCLSTHSHTSWVLRTRRWLSTGARGGMLGTSHLAMTRSLTCCQLPFDLSGAEPLVTLSSYLIFARTPPRYAALPMSSSLRVL